MDFFKTLIRPDHEKHPDRAAIGRAANLLQIGEFQFLQLAYRAWYGRELPPTCPTMWGHLNHGSRLKFHYP